MKINFEDYLNQIPNEFEFALKGIGNKFRLALSILLIDHGPLSFSNIAKITGREKSLIGNHLKKLELGGIIQNFLQKKEDTNEYSFYEITEYGKNIVSNLILCYNSYYSKLEHNVEEGSQELRAIKRKYINKKL